MNKDIKITTHVFRTGEMRGRDKLCLSNRERERERERKGKTKIRMISTVWRTIEETNDLGVIASLLTEDFATDREEEEENMHILMSLFNMPIT